MILSIRGTSGSGKSHLVRRLLLLLTWQRDIFIPDKRKMCGSVWCRADGTPALVTAGSYSEERSAPGADTMTEFTTDEQFRFFEECCVAQPVSHLHVIYEGLLVSGEVNRTVATHRTHPTTVIFLSTPIEECIASINERRRRRGVLSPVSEKNTRSKHAGLLRARDRLRTAGVPTVYTDRETAYEICRQVLEL